MKIKLLFVVVLVLVVVAGVIFYFVTKTKEKKNTTPNNPTVVESSDENHPFGFTSLSKEEAEVAKEIGITVVRASFSWDQIEPSEGKFNFDKFINPKDSPDFTPLVRLRMQQSWATNCKVELCKNNKDCPRKLVDCPPKDLGNWSNKGYSPTLYDFVYKTLEFTHSKNYPVQKIIVGNEVNSPVFWLGTSEDYVKTRGTIYKAVHDLNNKVQSQYQVVDNGFASAVWEYAIARDAYCNGQKNYAKDFAERTFRREVGIARIDQEVEKTNCSKTYESEKILDDAFKVDPNLHNPSFDFMSYHFYEPWDTQEEIINWIKEKMKKNGYDRPILNTEGGFIDRIRTSYDKNPELKSEVANDIVKIHVVAFANNVRTWLWLPLIEEYTGETTGEQLKGLETPDRKKLPAYNSYKTMVQKIDGFKTIEKVTGFSSPYIFKVSFKSKNPVYVLWSTKSETLDFSPKLKGSVKQTKIDGTTQNVNTSSIIISQDPIYLE